MSDPRLRNVVLRYGSHPTREDGMCAMELAAYLAGERHTDHPRCVHPDLRALVIDLNDTYKDDQQRTVELMPLVLASIGTAGTVMDIAPVTKAYYTTTATAGKARDEATAKALKAYNDATAPAEQAYDDAIHRARKVRDEATAAARKAYYDAAAAAQSVYHDAIAPAKKAYDDATAAAQSVYHDAIATARRDCIAALLAECSRCRAEKESTITTTRHKGATQ